MTKELKRYYELMEERPQEFLKSEIIDIITDETTIEEFCRKNNVKTGVVYESKYHIMVVDVVKDKNGRMFTYERILNTVPGGSVVITIHNDKFVLLEQFRHAMRCRQYAFPRGFKELKISNIENAKKELNEEIKVNNSDNVSYRFIGNIIADSGLCGNVADVYLCTITDDEDISARATEGIVGTKEVTQDGLNDMIRNGSIDDGFSLAAYSLFCAKTEKQP